ncbi:MAG: phosphotransferase [Bacteroidota bacterium]
MRELHEEIIQTTGASKITQSESVQRLWSGYGEIRRHFLEGGKYSSVIVKHIQPPEAVNHPRGWNTGLSNKRKLKSYQVEREWYKSLAHHTNELCRIPQCYHSLEQGHETLLIMEDLDSSGYPIRLNPDSVALEDVKNCLTWLANFHAQFMGQSPESLWPIGTYWHLDTRPDEWDRMTNIPLKKAAKDIDEHLNKAKFQTLVHGDAKLANFCFSQSKKVAAVDFQYVGGGCGMKDVAYCISSCFDEEECERHEKDLLDHYFSQLEISLDKSIDFQLVKEEWQELYKYAWADFYRFLDGWSPQHWKMHSYSEKLTQQVLKEVSS